MVPGDTGGWQAWGEMLIEPERPNAHSEMEGGQLIKHVLRQATKNKAFLKAQV